MVELIENFNKSDEDATEIAFNLFIAGKICEQFPAIYPKTYKGAGGIDDLQALIRNGEYDNEWVHEGDYPLFEAILREFQENYLENHEIPADLQGDHDAVEEFQAKFASMLKTFCDDPDVKDGFWDTFSGRLDVFRQNNLEILWDYPVFLILTPEKYVDGYRNAIAAKVSGQELAKKMLDCDCGDLIEGELYLIVFDANNVPNYYEDFHAKLEFLVDETMKVVKANDKTHN